MFFQNRSPGAFLEGPSAKQHVQFSWFSKRHPLDHLLAQAVEQKRSAPNDAGRTSRDPAFHETIVITVPFGPSCFKNVISSMKFA